MAVTMIEHWGRICFVSDSSLDEKNGLICPGCGENIEPEDVRWFSRVAFCRRCHTSNVAASKFERIGPPRPPSRLRDKMKEVRNGRSEQPNAVTTGPTE